MAKQPGTEQPADDSADGSMPSDAAPVASQSSADAPWTDDSAAAAAQTADSSADSDLTEENGSAPDSRGRSAAHGTLDAPEAREQVRRTDADRWAASFSNSADQPDPRGRAHSRSASAASGPAAAAAPAADDRPSWAAHVPVPSAGPAWRTDAPARSWTTDVPSGFSWGPDAAAPSAGQQGTPTNGASVDDDPVQDHAIASRGALDRTAQAFPPKRRLPPPAAFPVPPNVPTQQRNEQPYGHDSYGHEQQGHVQQGHEQHRQDQYGSQYGAQYGGPQESAYGEQSHRGYPESSPHPGHQSGPMTGSGQRYEAQPGSQSGWSGAPPPAPPPAPQSQQWQQAPAPQPSWQPPAPHGAPVERHASSADLTSGSLVKAAAAVPRVGWRKMVHSVTGGAVNPGLSQAELDRRNLIERATAPVRGCHRIAVVSLKGGIGKTTTTAGLGLTLAEHRGDRVVALDANPDAGTLAERLTGQIDVTVRDMLDSADSIRSFTDVSAFTSLAARLQVLASEQDPEMSEAFSEAEYRMVADILARYFNIVLTDSGTGLLHSAMSGTLALADSLVVVGSPSVDGASRASKTLDWLIAHGHRELVSRAVAVISTVRPASKELDMLRLREHFGARVRAVVEIPYDRHLVTGGIIDMAQLDKPTEQAFLELSAIVADGFRLPTLIRPDSEPAARSSR
ncbi:MAG: MinD/ParA family protein [Actinomycetota bacterium]|nr:MinD/ParA family protein [Actinomycetota bacterium]